MLPLSYSFLTYEDQKKDLENMTMYDKQVYQSFSYKDKELSDIEQIVASLKCVIPDVCPHGGILPPSFGWEDGPVGDFDTIANNKNVTGMAHNLSYK
jgi:hypothetical protein